MISPRRDKRRGLGLDRFVVTKGRWSLQEADIGVEKVNAMSSMSDWTGFDKDRERTHVQKHILLTPSVSLVSYKKDSSMIACNFRTDFDVEK